MERTTTGTAPPPRLDGELRVDEASRAAAAVDFGHLVHRTPEAVLLPGSRGDVAAVIRWAAQQGRTVAAQGQRHSVYGRAQAGAGVVVDMRRRRSIRRVGDDRAVVDAGATWRELLAATLPRGLTPPVLPDYLDLTIGGTLVVGGVGGATPRLGLASDHVIDLEVVTGTGETVPCSATTNRDVFDAVRAGLGQVGVITTAALALVPAPARSRRYLLTYPDLRALLDDQRVVSADGRFDGLQGSVVPAPDGWTYRLEGVQHFSGTAPDDATLLDGLADDRPLAQLSTLPYREHLDRLAGLETVLRESGQWYLPHPWLLTYLGDSQVESVVGDELAALTPADLGPYGQVLLTAFPREVVSSPLLRLPTDPLCFIFNLMRFPASDDPAEADRLVRANRATYERVRAAGGTLYPVSAFPMSPEDWREHFGPAFTRLRDAKEALDPGHVLTPGYEIWEQDPTRRDA